MRHNGRTSLFELRDMIGFSGDQAGLPDGRWVRAVPAPFPFGLLGRLRQAWAVITGDAVAVTWPNAGDLEAALNPHNGPAAPLPKRPPVRLPFGSVRL